MKPKVEMRIKDIVVVIMLRAKTLKVCDDTDNRVTWADNYEPESDERKCFELAKAKKGNVTQVNADVHKVRFYFRFADDAIAKEFCKELEAICST